MIYFILGYITGLITTIMIVSLCKVSARSEEISGNHFRGIAARDNPPPPPRAAIHGGGRSS